MEQEIEAELPTFDFAAPEEPEYNPFEALAEEEAAPAPEPNSEVAELRAKIAEQEARIAAFPQTVAPQAPQPYYPQQPAPGPTQDQVIEELRNKFYADPGKASFEMLSYIDKIAEQKAQQYVAPALQAAAENAIQSFKAAHSADPIAKAAMKKFEAKLNAIPVTQRSGINSDGLSLLLDASIGEYYREQSSKPRAARPAPEAPPYGGGSKPQAARTAPKTLDDVDKLAVNTYRRAFPNATHAEIIEMLNNG